MAPCKKSATQDIAKLKRQCGNARSLFEKSSRAVKAALQQRVQQLESELIKERVRSAGLVRELKAANSKASESLRTQLDAERKKNAQAQSKLNEADAKLKIANDSRETLRAALMNQRDSCGKVTAELKAERKRSADMENQLNAERKKNVDLENQLKLLRDKALPHAIFKECSCLFAPAHNFDFRNVSDAGKTFVRGGVPYIRPSGSMRHALEVANRYDDKDWLKDDADGWAVAYHGTSRENAVSIVRNGFHLSKGTRFGYGPGVYCTPDPNTAKGNYSTDFAENGKTGRVIVQVRVKPGQYKVVWPGNGVQKEYGSSLIPPTFAPTASASTYF
ncbi:hypothetical protein AAVH_27550 [Aphelenchoides avenae]|nr:hypothetical protein AAVH_27550 [Aphelenchus avenae]